MKFDAVALSKPKDQYTSEELKALTEQKLDTIEAEIFIWTDGSTSGSQERGGAGVYIQDKVTGESSRQSYPEGELCSSFGAEGVAMLESSNG